MSRSFESSPRSVRLSLAFSLFVVPALLLMALLQESRADSSAPQPAPPSNVDYAPAPVEPVDPTLIAEVAPQPTPPQPVPELDQLNDTVDLQPIIEAVMPIDDFGGY